MRRLFAALLVVPALGWLGCNLLIGLEEGHPGDLCGWLEHPDSNCVSQLYGSPAKPQCGDGQGSFSTGTNLETCILKGGSSVVFDPAINPMAFPPDKPTQIKFISSTGAECGSFTYKEPFSFSVTVNPGADASGVTTLALDHEASSNELSVSCPSSQASSETRHFNLDQLSGSGCPKLAEIVPKAIFEITPSSTYHPGLLHLEVRYPSSNGGPPAASYFDCSFPAVMCPADGIKSESEVDVDCGGPESVPGCPARCSEGKLCKDDCDCAAATACALDVQTGMKMCSSSASRNDSCAGPICSNQVKDKDSVESDTDCGGVCPLCAEGKMCGKNADCLSHACMGGKCIAATCTDLARNGSETDVDCGGVCPNGCADGQKCDGAADCVNKGCLDGICSPCANSVKDGTETDVDCGGANCTGCAETKSCTTNDDCLTKVCTGGSCNGCSNGKKDDKESDLDCGGPHCSKCADGKTCTAASDCSIAGCLNGLCSQCADGKQDGDESDIDCGGASCPKCANGKKCVTISDCANGVCDGYTCGSCFDGMKNGTETDIDCGGACSTKCPEDKACTGNSDCALGVCELPPTPDGGVQSPGVCNTCNDMGQSGTETDIDCGGATCPKCKATDSCKVNLDCSSGICIGKVCQ